MGIVREVAKGNRVHFEFKLGEDVFRGQEIPLYNRPVPSAGDKITIYYDSEIPTVNGITDFQQRSFDALGPVPFALLASGVVIFVILYRRHSVKPKG